MINRYQFMSVSFHLLMLILGILLFQPFITPKQLAESRTMIHAYLQFNNQQKANSAKSIKHQAIILKPKAIRKYIPERRIEKEVVVENHATAIQQKGEEIDDLLRLLHRTIQSAQQYPKSAQAMHKEGRVTVQFKLMKNGEVRDLALQRSSGISSLDKAALDAVNRAQPFHSIDHYLSGPRIFSIDIVFALS